VIAISMPSGTREKTSATAGEQPATWKKNKKGVTAEATMIAQSYGEGEAKRGKGGGRWQEKAGTGDIYPQKLTSLRRALKSPLCNLIR